MLGSVPLACTASYSFLRALFGVEERKGVDAATLSNQMASNIVARDCAGKRKDKS